MSVGTVVAAVNAVQKSGYLQAECFFDFIPFILAITVVSPIFAKTRLGFKLLASSLVRITQDPS